MSIPNQLIDSLNEFYKLKNNYEIEIEKEKRKIIKNPELSWKEKRREYNKEYWKNHKEKYKNRYNYNYNSYGIFYYNTVTKFKTFRDWKKKDFFSNLDSIEKILCIT